MKTLTTSHFLIILTTAFVSHATYAGTYWNKPFDEWNSIPQNPSQTSTSTQTSSDPYSGQNNGSGVSIPDSSNQSLYGRWVVGNGGDSLRLQLASAKRQASTMVNKLNELVLRDADADIREFILTNKEKLASNLVSSPHVWDLQERPTCAWTSRPEIDSEKEAIEIYFSYPTCRNSLKSFTEATKLLLHETAHHFDKNEDFADRMAITIINAWTSGALEWQPLATDSQEEARMGASMVTDGSKLIVFGGLSVDQVSSSGAIYDLSQQKWTAMNTSNSKGRYLHSAVLYDKKMLVWGGFMLNGDGSTYWQNTGSIYDLSQDRWMPIEPASQKIIEFHVDVDPVQTLTLAGNKAFIWGGIDDRDNTIGYIYDFGSGTLKTVNTNNAPRRLAAHSAVYVNGETAFEDPDHPGNKLAGEGVIIWGGVMGAGAGDRNPVGEGSYYHFATKSWHRIQDSGAPTPRSGHKAIWTGSEMFVYSGSPTGRNKRDSLLHASAGLYNLKTNSWDSFTSQIGVERTGHTMVWSGSEALIMGGKSRYLGSYYSDVIAFNPETKSWRSISGKKAPAARWQHSAVWTGEAMVIFGGGISYTQSLSDGSIFYP